MATFTDAKVKALRAKDERYEMFEGNGFGIRVTPRGVKSWVWLYRYAGKVRRLTLGEYNPGSADHMGLAAARAEHAANLALLEKGTNPADLKREAQQAEREAPTVAQLAGEYLERWAKPKKASWQEDERMLAKDILPKIGKLKAQEVRRRDIIRILDRVADRGALVAANRIAA